MKKLFFIVCCAALLVTGCKDGKNSPESTNVHLADSLNEVIAQRDSEINDNRRKRSETGTDGRG